MCRQKYPYQTKQSKIFQTKEKKSFLIKEYQHIQWKQENKNRLGARQRRWSLPILNNKIQLSLITLFDRAKREQFTHTLFSIYLLMVIEWYISSSIFYVNVCVCVWYLSNDIRVISVMRERERARTQKRFPSHGIYYPVVSRIYFHSVCYYYCYVQFNGIQFDERVNKIDKNPFRNVRWSEQLYRGLNVDINLFSRFIFSRKLHIEPMLLYCFYCCYWRVLFSWLMCVYMENWYSHC